MSRVHIVAAVAGAAGGEAGDPRDIVSTLARLGPEVAVERVDSLEAAGERASGADLVVVEGAHAGAAESLLEVLREEGPPLLAVVEREGDADALEWFRNGAADCVAAGDDFEHVLRAVALEHIGRWRSLRDQRLAERRIRWLERLNDAIVSEIPAALAVLHPDHRIVMVNPAFCATWGVDADAVAGRPLAEILPPQLMEAGGLGGALARTSAGGEGAALIAHTLDGQGAARAFDVRTARLDDAGRLLLALADVTERESLVQRIEDLKGYNEKIIQNMNSALLVVDPSGRITFANPMAGHILGVDCDELAGRSAWDWFPSAPTERDLLSRTLSDGSRYRGAETILSRPDGSVIPVGISCAPLTGADGAPMGAVAIFQDLTEIKQLQRQVLQNEKMASIGQLAAGVAHEINNPMGFIHANLCQMADYLKDLQRLWEAAQELRRTAGSGGGEDLDRAVGALDVLSRELQADYLLDDFGKAIRESQEGSERIRHIVRDLRDFSRHDSSERVQADVNLALDSTANIVWSMMKHSVVLRKQYGDLPLVRCYPMQLKQLFMNLLVNGYQAIEERVGESGETGEIELWTERRGETVVISVSNSGVPIPPENLDRIFDPFFTTKEVGVGVGLGLSTSFNIARQHGGTIRAANRPGGGATFVVTLPIDDEGEPG